MDSNLIEKIRKLLRLSQSPNANEAAAAAAKAQQLIDEHNLSAAILSLDGEPDSASDEPIVDFQSKDAPLDRRARIDRWAGYLAGVIARANGCRTYFDGGDIALVGRPSDAETVRYLYGYLSREVNRLCDQDGVGCGRTWRNNYRLGVVDTISQKLRKSREQFAAEQRRLAAASSSTALVRVNQAMAKVEQRGSDVVTWLKQNVKLRNSSPRPAAFHSGAREAGRKAGHQIAINRAKRALSA